MISTMSSWISGTWNSINRCTSPSAAREKHDQRALVRFADVEHVGADAVVDTIVFARDLLGERQQRLVLVVEQNVHVALFVTLDDAHHDIVQLGRIRVVNGVALGLADALHDDLFRGLRGDAAEIFGRHLFIEEVAGLRTSNRLRALEISSLGSVTSVDDVAAMIDFVFAGLSVDRHDRVRFGAEVSLVGRDQRRFERFEQHSRS